MISLNNLANAYLDRIRGEPSDNIERALALYRQALAVLGSSADAGNDDLLALVSQNRGLAYRDRLHGDPEEDCKQAAQDIGRAVDFHEQRGSLLPKASALVNLGSVFLVERFRSLETREGDLNRAIEHLMDALALLNEQTSAEVWATAQVLLGQAYMERARFGGREQNLRTAISHLETSLRIHTRDRDPLAWAQVLQTLGGVHSMIGESDKGIRYYNEALEVYTVDFPFERRRTLKNIGNCWFERGVFEEALVPYEEAIAIGRDLLWNSHTLEAKQVEAAEISILYPNVAYSLLALGRPEEALVMLERGKTRLLVQALSLSDLFLERLEKAERERIQSLREEISGHERLLIALTRDGAEQDLQQVRDRLEHARASLRSELQEEAQLLEPDLSVTQILELARPGECLVVPVITPRGGALFLIPSGAATIRESNILWLDSAELYQMLHPGQPVYDPESSGDLSGWLHWYGVWRSDTSEDTREDREYCMERLLEGRLTGTQRSERAPLCVAVKRYKDFFHLRPLRFAHTEAREVARITEAKLLLDSEASSASILEHVSEFTHIHFACHATLSSDPLAVALQLGGHGAAARDELPVKRIMPKMDLSGARLISLAACESGVVEHLHSADEYVGLPGALPQAGAAAVISSLFVVHDLASCCLLWRAFYDFHWNKQMTPAAALRAAQIWLRDLTSDGLKQIADSWQTKEPVAAEEARFFALTERPFSHPLLWSGFVYVGA